MREGWSERAKEEVRGEKRKIKVSRPAGMKDKSEEKGKEGELEVDGTLKPFRVRRTWKC